jgi:hypothetical protein
MRAVTVMVLTAICVALFSVDVGAVSQVVRGPDLRALFDFDPTYVLVFGAALSTGALTLADWAKRLDPTGKVSDIVELLSQSNELLSDMQWIEGNLPTGHRTTMRTGLPAVAWRLINAGVVPSKSTTAQIDEQSGILEAWSEVDVALAKLNGNTAAFRLSEARAFIEAMNQEMAQTLFYGNGGIAPEEFTGLAPRYSLLSAGNGGNILDAGGVDAADNSSIWLVAWSPETVSGIFPKGSQAGLQHDDYGEQTIQVTAGVAGTRMRALQERWVWNAGIQLADWRYVIRIANIDISNLAGGGAADLIDLMEQALEMLPNSLGRPVFYMNRTVARYLRKQERADVTSGGGLTFANLEGKRVMDFGGVPVRRVDALLNTEARVV